MKPTSITHWIGVLFLLAASLCLLFTTISAPIMNDNGLLRVILTNQTDFRNSSYSFGTFGYCVLDVPPVNTDQDWCTKTHVGYDPAHPLSIADGTEFSHLSAGFSDGLTRVMVLHPVCCGLAFIAFLISLGAGVFGSLIGAMVAFLAWILTTVVMAVDFSLFGNLRNHVNQDGSGSHARFGAGMWTVLAAFILLFLGMIIVFFTCFSARKEKRRDRNAVKNEQTYIDGPGEPVKKKRFGLF